MRLEELLVPTVSFVLASGAVARNTTETIPVNKKLT